MKISDIFKTASNKQNKVKDPIYGMKVDLEKTKFKSTYKGKVYGFVRKVAGVTL